MNKEDDLDISELAQSALGNTAQTDTSDEDYDDYDDLPEEDIYDDTSDREDDIEEDDDNDDNEPGITKTNVAPFFERQKIIVVLFVFILLIIFFVTIILPLFNKDSKKEEELEERGLVNIPGFVEEWKSKKTNQTTAPVTNDTDNTEYVIDLREDTEKMDDKILADIPFSDEAKTNVAPVNVDGTVAGTSESTRPETNSNEQQKALQRMTMNNSSQGQNIGNTNINGLPYTSDNYSNYAQDRMNNLTDTLTSMYSGQSAQGMGSTSTDSYNTQNNQSNKQAFSNQNAGNVGMQINNEYSVYKGTVIDAVLVTGINTDLPGEVIARVTKNVYSSLYGQYLLIPAGSLLMASYNSSVSYGQDRIQVAWNTLIRPDGVEINLGNMTGVDEHGYAGYGGFVNEHPFEYLKAMGLIAAYSIVDTKMNNLTNNQTNQYTENVLTDTYSAVSKLGTKMLDKALDIQPTITIKQGSEIKIITNITMDLPPSAEVLATQKYKRN